KAEGYLKYIEEIANCPVNEITKAFMVQEFLPDYQGQEIFISSQVGVNDKDQLVVNFVLATSIHDRQKKYKQEVDRMIVYFGFLPQNLPTIRKILNASDKRLACPILLQLAQQQPNLIQVNVDVSNPKGALPYAAERFGESLAYLILDMPDKPSDIREMQRRFLQGHQSQEQVRGRPEPKAASPRPLASATNVTDDAAYWTEKLEHSKGFVNERDQEKFNELWESFFKFLGKDATVLDVATGLGSVAQEAVKVLGKGKVYSIDVAEVPSERVPSDVIFRQLGVAQLGGVNHPEDLPKQFKGVVSQFGWEYEQDKEAAVKEIASVVSPGGRFLAMMHHAKSEFVENHQIDLDIAQNVKDWALEGTIRYVITGRMPLSPQNLVGTVLPLMARIKQFMVAQDKKFKELYPMQFAVLGVSAEVVSEWVASRGQKDLSHYQRVFDEALEKLKEDCILSQKLIATAAIYHDGNIGELKELIERNGLVVDLTDLAKTDIKQPLAWVIGAHKPSLIEKTQKAEGAVLVAEALGALGHNKVQANRPTAAAPVPQGWTPLRKLKEDGLNANCLWKRLELLEQQRLRENLSDNEVSFSKNIYKRYLLNLLGVERVLGQARLQTFLVRRQDKAAENGGVVYHVVNDPGSGVETLLAVYQDKARRKNAWIGAAPVENDPTTPAWEKFTACYQEHAQFLQKRYEDVSHGDRTLNMERQLRLSLCLMLESIVALVKDPKSSALININGNRKQILTCLLWISVVAQDYSNATFSLAKGLIYDITREGREEGLLRLFEFKSSSALVYQIMVQRAMEMAMALEPVGSCAWRKFEECRCETIRQSREIRQRQVRVWYGPKYKVDRPITPVQLAQASECFIKEMCYLKVEPPNYVGLEVELRELAKYRVWSEFSIEKFILSFKRLWGINYLTRSLKRNKDLE
ncbi:MAG: methyltransferase domain-containing protein, partial [Candidatus Omnitrophota bacterium]